MLLVSSSPTDSPLTVAGLSLWLSVVVAPRRWSEVELRLVTVDAAVKPVLFDAGEHMLLLPPLFDAELVDEPRQPADDDDVV